MLSWVSVLLCAAALGTTGRWYVRRVDGLGRPRSFPSLSVALAVVLAVGALVPGVLHAREESRLSAVASTLAGARVKVHCQSLHGAFVDVGAELGYVRYGVDGIPEHQTLIKRDQCGALSSYLRSTKRRPTLDQIIAVHVLTHESMHMAGMTSEAAAECAAVQRDALTSRLLGAEPAQAAALARAYWQAVYPRMPSEYVSADCGPNAPLDEGREDGPWSGAAPGVLVSG